MAQRNEPADMTANASSGSGSSTTSGESAAKDVGRRADTSAQGGSRGRSRSAAKPEAQAEAQGRSEAETQPDARPQQAEALAQSENVPPTEPATQTDSAAQQVNGEPEAGQGKSKAASLDELRENFKSETLAKQTPEERLAAMRRALEILRDRRPPGTEAELMEIIEPLIDTETSESKDPKAAQHHIELIRTWHEIKCELAEPEGEGQVTKDADQPGI